MLFLLFLLAFITFLQRTNAAASYISDFVDPDFILSREFAIHTYPAEVSIVKWARQFSLKGPWCNKHDYMSWSP
ncbi:hypothetical protein MPER_05159, partial [Moniliophthora perniciosa FA553]